ncbi:amino acid ABC transporter permease [Cellulomonas carbonis]|uniref:Polar amino acid ABC transporter permease n=1 Tax=Cellulomonas carbonis T26 TaxID=947969 RepID=A0A0A0BW48_9CELL|nr:amino acid ABC transporter permease [Cellulomonas carbonis]KGM12146.1 polar amino acid ABC transporter permease [Cellulomonas carbonis T26]GGB97402.1 glutamate ABC transporter permease [Cellulomonas carbonis]
MTSVLYDAPGPVARRRERWGSVIGSVVVLVLLAVGAVAAARNGVFDADRWDVLYDPPKQTAADVWRSLLVTGLGATLRAAALAAPLALALGVALAVWRSTRLRALRIPAVGVIELFRGVPVLLMMFFALLALKLSSFEAVVFGLVVYNMAIVAEILRAGLAALPKGQAEAAYALGLSRPQTLFTILLPQAVRLMMPSLVAQMVVLLKDSSLGFIVGYQELLKVIQNNSYFYGNNYAFALFTVGTVVYLTVNLSLSWFARWLARRTSAQGNPEAVAEAAQRPGTGPGADAGARPV